MRNDSLGSSCKNNEGAGGFSQDGRLGIKSFGRKIESFVFNFLEMPWKHPGDVR